jgi:hypothetical protein
MASTKRKIEAEAFPEFELRYKISDSLKGRGVPKKNRLDHERLVEVVVDAQQSRYRSERCTAGFWILDDPYTVGHDLQVILVQHPDNERALVELRACLNMLGVEELYYEQETWEGWAVVVRQLTGEQEKEVSRTLSLIVVNWTHLAEFAATLASSPARGSETSSGGVKLISMFGQDVCVWSGSDHGRGTRSQPTLRGLLNDLIDSGKIEPFGVISYSGKAWAAITSPPSKTEMQKIQRAQARA